MGCLGRYVSPFFPGQQKMEEKCVSHVICFGVFFFLRLEKFDLPKSEKILGSLQLLTTLPCLSHAEICSPPISEEWVSVIECH